MFLGLLYILNMIIQKQVFSSLNTQSLFFNYYNLSATMKEYVFHTNLMLIYGNYIKADGMYIEDIPDSTPGQNLTQFWMKVRPRLREYFDEGDSAKIDKYLTDDLCLLTDAIVDIEERTTLRQLCESYLPTKKGMLSLWTSMQELCAANRLYLRKYKADWLTKSRTAFYL
jgi:hypothetical protein